MFDDVTIEAEVLEERTRASVQRPKYLDSGYSAYLAPSLREMEGEEEE